MRWGAGRYLGAASGLLMVAGALTGLSPASAATAACRTWTAGKQPPPAGTDDELAAVAVPSASEAWAVGRSSSGGTDQPLIEHWKGSAWSAVPSPVHRGSLASVRSASPSSVWAVGTSVTGKGLAQTLILHWNGKTWTRQPSPSPGSSFSELQGVRAVSARSAWAVGQFSNGRGNRTLILHWNGTAWKRVSSPNPAASDNLSAVAAASPASAWAVGLASTSTAGVRQGARQSVRAARARDGTLILHWNGSKWSRAASPSPGVFSSLEGVGATSASNAWAAGSTESSATSDEQTLILRWDGKSWQRVTSPDPGSGTDNDLTAVTATSASNAWAVGGFGGSSTQSLILRWNGTKWQQVQTPVMNTSNFLNGVAANSASNAWAVGYFFNGPNREPLALHCR